MTWLLGLSRLIDRLTAFVGRWVAWFIFAATVVSAGNAVIRKVFDESSNAWLELQWYLFGAAYMLASAYTLQRNEHVRIDILYGMWPRRVQHWIDLIAIHSSSCPSPRSWCSSCGLTSCRSVHSGELSTNAGGLILWPAKSLLLIGFALLWLQGVSEIIKKIAIMRGVIEDPNPHVSAHAPLEDVSAAETN